MKMMRGITGLVASIPIALSSAAAFADDRDDILASCAVNIGLPPTGCECIADKAMSEFDENEFAFFMAVVNGDRDAQTAAAMNLTPQQMLTIGDRMNDMPGECAG